MQSTSCKLPGWIKHKLEARLHREISITSDMQIYSFMGESEEELKSLLMKVKEESEKAGLQMYRTEFWTLWEKARVGCFKRTASKHVYYLG